MYVVAPLSSLRRVVLRERFPVRSIAEVHPLAADLAREPRERARVAHAGRVRVLEPHLARDVVARDKLAVRVPPETETIDINPRHLKSVMDAMAMVTSGASLRRLRLSRDDHSHLPRLLVHRP